MKLKVEGRVKLAVNFEVELDMSEKDFEALSESKQNELIEDAIDWYETMRTSTTDEIDVWDYAELK